MLWLGDLTSWLVETMERYISMNRLETASSALIIPRMSVLRNLLVPLSMLLVKLPLSVILTAFMFTTSMPRDLNGMKFAANRLKTTIP